MSDGGRFKTGFSTLTDWVSYHSIIKKKIKYEILDSEIRIQEIHSPLNNTVVLFFLSFWLCYHKISKYLYI